MMKTYAAILDEIAAQPPRNVPVETPTLTTRDVSFCSVSVSTTPELQGVHITAGEKPVPDHNASEVQAQL